MSDYIKVANTTDLKSGDGMVIELAGRTIALFNINGEFFAIDNTCGHRGGPLGEGYCDPARLTVQCPWHGWVYNLATGASLMDAQIKVEKFDVKVEGDDVKLSLG